MLKKLILTVLIIFLTLSTAMGGDLKIEFDPSLKSWFKTVDVNIVTNKYGSKELFAIVEPNSRYGTLRLICTVFDADDIEITRMDRTIFSPNKSKVSFGLCIASALCNADEMHRVKLSTLGL
ncbi:MAG: hypothetical protein JEZ11_24550 [Desulfobacterales bacterium]|nr:hypothetical protein [Desulfobacterales bacterium]